MVESLDESNKILAQILSGKSNQEEHGQNLDQDYQVPSNALYENDLQDLQDIIYNRNILNEKIEEYLYRVLELQGQEGYSRSFSKRGIFRFGKK